MTPAEPAPESPAQLPPDSELVIGLVGAVGVDLSPVAVSLGAEFAQFRYRTVDVHITDVFDAFTWPTPLVDEPFDERLWSYMDAGNELRDKWKRRDAMALLAINRIALERADLTGSEAVPGARVAYILRSFKRPEEVAFLRDVYGSRFLLIGVAAAEDARREFLSNRIRETRLPPHELQPRYSPEQLIARDEREEHIKYGQDVRDTFHRADCFVRIDNDLPTRMRRVLDIFFNDPVRSPTRDEFGMFQAVAAARRSAELGRQVGAAICTAEGDVVAVGVNEVPRAGGGLYWEGDSGDGREVTLGSDTNLRHRRDISEDIAERLHGNGLLPENADREKVLECVEGSALGDIIEFMRAVHAEMAALIDAARRGAKVDGCTLFATTFPCHHCARHIVAAGIKRVVYVAPYAKSRAVDLHDDAIVLGPASAEDPRVPFEPFVGVGPLRYLDWFEYPERKTKDGALRSYERTTAEARLADRDPLELRSDRLPYLDREHRASVLLQRCESASGFAMQRPEPSHESA
jgi:deoxycytidylate deaminase